MSVFKRRRFPAEIIMLCVRWYCRYGISYRDLEEMMAEGGVAVDHVTKYPSIAHLFLCDITEKDSAASPPWRAILEVSWRYWCASGCQSPGNNYLLRCALCLRAVSQPVRQSGLNPKVYKSACASGGHNGWWLGRSHLLRNLP
jgi:hypothetical protein